MKLVLVRTVRLRQRLFAIFAFGTGTKIRGCHTLRTSTPAMKFIDIGVNLTDGMFRGVYHGSKKHDDDLEEVIKRAEAVGMQKMIITGGSLSDSKRALEMAESRDSLYCTVGCHPTRCNEFAESPDTYKEDLIQLIRSDQQQRKKVVAVGECGLDYDRLHFCDKETQIKYFTEQFDISSAVNLPMFIHSRSCSNDILPILEKYRNTFPTGVVHSFDGSAEDVKAIIDLDLYIGINGCSLKTATNLEVVKQIPTDRILIETDAPWCEIKPSHSSHPHIKSHITPDLLCKKEKFRPGCRVKGRNEPANIVHVLEVLSSICSQDPETLAEQIYENTVKCFFANR